MRTRKEIEESSRKSAGSGLNLSTRAQMLILEVLLDIREFLRREYGEPGDYEAKR